MSLSHLKSFVNVPHALNSFPSSSSPLACLSYKTGLGGVILDIYETPEPKAAQQWHCTEAGVRMRACRPSYCNPFIRQEAELPWAPSCAEEMQ